MDYSLFDSISLYAFNVPRGSLYSFKRDNEGSNPSNLKAYEGQESGSLDSSKEKSKIVCLYAHILMYAVLVVIPAYIRAYRFKSHVYHFSHVFRDDQGNIKGQKMVHMG